MIAESTEVRNDAIQGRFVDQIDHLRVDVVERRLLLETHERNEGRAEHGQKRQDTHRNNQHRAPFTNRRPGRLSQRVPTTRLPMLPRTRPQRVRPFIEHHLRLLDLLSI